MRATCRAHLFMLAAQDVPHHDASAVLRAARLGPGLLLGRGSLGLLVRGLYHAVHTDAQRDVAGEQRGAHVGQQAVRKVSDFV